VAPTSLVINGNHELNSNISVVGSVNVSQANLSVISLLSITEDLHISNSSVITLGDSSLIYIQGTLTIDSSSVLQIGPNSTLVVTECVNIAGRIEVKLPPNQDSGSLKLLNFTCGTVGNDQIRLIVGDPCKEVSEQSSKSLNSQLSVQFSLIDKCKKKNTLDTWQIAAIIAGVIAFIIVAIAVIVVFAVPSIRAKVFPHNYKFRLPTEDSTTMTPKQ
jgi:hypothetical protein